MYMKLGVIKFQIANSSQTTCSWILDSPNQITDDNNYIPSNQSPVGSSLQTAEQNDAFHSIDS